ncbi:MAG: transglycosylase SLT domain-containing protein [Proteobacteria bacterium]|nr:transglycosylase SLT domain-containing protein [Pseudomonadota bacterium]
MTQSKWILLIILMGNALLGTYSFATPLPPDDLEAQRDIYVRAEHAFKKHDYANYEKLSQKITTYPLYPYLIYDDLKRKISQGNVSAEKIKQFKKNYPDFPYLTALDTLYLNKLAKQKHWETFVKHYQPYQNEELACYYHYAQYELTNDKVHLEDAKPLWLVGYSQSPACDKLFAAWAKSGGLTQHLIWERFKLSLEAKNEDLSKHLVKQINSKDRSAAQLWIKLAKDPNLITTEKFHQSLVAPNKIKAQMITFGLQRLAKQNPEKALKWWQKNSTLAKFTNKQKAQIERDIAVYLCHQRSVHAKEWLASLHDDTLDIVGREWRIRLALAEKDWPHVLKLINELPNDLKNDISWRYWQARALDATGNKEQARALYQQVATQRNYYGFSASLRLEQPISLQHKETPVDAHMMLRVEEIPAIARFKELNILGKEAVGRVEWFRALDKMNEQEILCAAKLAKQWDHPDIAIFTMARADFKDDVPLRFPLAHREDVLKNAEKHNLDPAWIYGIARQESAFFNEAVSHAGARGLLQLLPSTAKVLAKKHDVKYESEYALHNPSTNIQLGAAYLQQLKQMMQNHLVLATASYNAGPTRTMRWLPKDLQEADIWIETIPYKETREYVKNVTTFTSIYRQRLGYPPAFALLMKPIPSKKS